MRLIKPLFYVLALCYLLPGCYSDVNQPNKVKKSTSGDRFGSSVVFPVTGNVYPQGYYHVTLNIGNPPKPYLLDIDTGSDLTWLQCDAPCTKCTPAPHKLYKPNKDLVGCLDPLCASIHWPARHHCESPNEQCDYEVEYADQGSSMGVLVKDIFPLKFINGTVAKPSLAFGCGYNQEVPESTVPPYTDGILGLGIGESSIVRQLSQLGVMKNIVGHCLSTQGGGYLFFGDKLVPSTGIIWTAMSTTTMEKHYSLGSAELYFGGKPAGMKGLQIVFDSGSTYTYLNSEAYKALVSMLTTDLKGKKINGANEDKSLPVCWKGSKPFKSINDVKNLFKPIMLTFTNSKNVRFQMDPEAYLIISKHGNACLGILDGTEVGLGNVNVIGDISMLNHIIIYDNEKQQIGWASANCNKLPNMDDGGDDEDPENEDFCTPYESNFGILQGYCSAKHSFMTRKKAYE